MTSSTLQATAAAIRSKELVEVAPGRGVVDVVPTAAITASRTFSGA